MPNKECIAFIDLVGTRDLARFDPDQYHADLSNFEKSIANRCIMLSNEDKIYFYSDCAYISSSNPASLFDFLTELRADLLPLGVFFKGGIVTGTLKARSLALTNDSSVEKAHRDKVIKGYGFGKEIVPAFAMQEAIKGIGISIVYSIAADHSEAMRNYYVEDIKSRKYKSFWDIKLSREDIDEANGKIIADRMIAAAINNFSYGRYYIPLLLNYIINSNINKTKKNQIEQWGPGFGNIIFRYAVNGTFERSVGDLPGIELIYFALIDQLLQIEHESYNPAAAVERILHRKRKTRMRQLRGAPTDIISDKNKGVIFRDVSAMLTPN